MLLTTTPDARRPTRLHIKIQPQDDEEATLMLTSNIRHLATADVPAPKVTLAKLMTSLLVLQAGIGVQKCPLQQFCACQDASPNSVIP